MYRHYYESVNGGEPACIDEQIPFDIPDSWEWVKLGTLCFVVSGTSYNKGDVRKDGIRILRGGNIQEEMLFLQDSDVYVPHSYKDEEKNVRKGDIILVASTGSLTAIGKAAYIYENCSDVQIGAFMRIVRPYSMEYAEYMGKFFTTDNYRSHIRSLVSGTNINNIKAEHLLTLMVPVPPIEEQHRILKRLEELSPKISEYAELHQKQEKQEESFPALLKKSILQHAIQGKLVPQDPNDEPASVLLERIAVERAKLGKKATKSMSRIERRDRGTFLISPDGSEADISDEIPFDIPETWSWCQLSDIAELQTGTTPSTSRTEYFGEGIPFIKPADILNGSINYHNESLTRLGAEKSRMVTKGALLMVCIGGSIGKCSLVDRDVCFNQQINAATPIIIESAYLHAYLSSSYIAKAIREKATGTATPIINKTLWGQLLIALPPYNEQLRICDKLHSIIPTLC